MKLIEDYLFNPNILPCSEEERAEIAEKVGDALEENAEALEKKGAISELGSSGKQENGHEVKYIRNSFSKFSSFTFIRF